MAGSARWILVCGMVAGLAVGAAGGQAKLPQLTSEQQAREAWRSKLVAQPAGTQCRTAKYPETVWHEVPCGAVKSSRPVAHVSPSRLVRPLDEAATRNITAQSSGSITSATGTLLELSNLGAVTGQPTGYSLQMNTNGFKTALCNGSHNRAGCVGWEQFYVESDGTYFIQTWLGNYLDAVTTTCPTGVTWNTFQPNAKVSPNGSCWRNAFFGSWTAVPLSELAGATLTAQSNANGTDTFTATINGTAFSTPATSGLLGLAGNWIDADFNVFGQIGGAEAVFNAGTLGSVAVTLQDGTGNAPKCAGERVGGFGTVESTNLTLGPCAAFGKLGTFSPGIVFYESVPPVLGQVVPRTGSGDGGEQATIFGTGLSSNVAVKFGGAYTQGRVVCTGGSSCTVTTPPGVGTVPVTAANLTVAGGEGVFSVSTGPQYNYRPVPHGRISPTGGPVGTTITITGNNFSTAAGGTVIYFQAAGTNTPVQIVTCKSTTVCVFDAPGYIYPKAATEVFVVANGESSSLGYFVYTVPVVHEPPVKCSVCRANGQTCKTVNGKNVCVGTVQ